MSDRSVPETLAGDPFAHAGVERRQLRRERRTEAELIEAIREDEAKLGRPMTHNERVGFARGFFGREYGTEIRLRPAQGVLDDEDEHWRRRDSGRGCYGLRHSTERRIM